MKFHTSPLLILLLFVACNRPALAPGHLVSLRLGSDSSETGMAAMNVESTGQAIFVATEDLVSSQDILKIEGIRDQSTGNHMIGISIDKQAGDRLRATTTQNTGKLCVLLVNNKPVIALPINAPFGSRIIIEGNFSEKDASTAVSQLTGY